MERSLRKLTKQLVEELNVYVDDDTGDEYVWDGSNLILVKKGGKVRIGDMGDEETRAEEEAERNRQAAAEGGVIETAEEAKERLKKLEKALNDEEVAKTISKEAKEKVSREQIKKEAAKTKRELEKFRDDPIIQFEDSLHHFLRKQMKQGREDTYAKFNKRYDEPGILKKGIRKFDKPDIPTVQVYFDRSASWDEDKTKIGRQAIATLDKYVRQGKLKINISYFNSVVFDTYIPDGRDGTRGTPILIDVLGKQPDNVIVMTDSDISDCNEYVEVPGVVWYLFVGGVSDNIMEHLTGRIDTVAYKLGE